MELRIFSVVIYRVLWFWPLNMEHVQSTYTENMHILVFSRVHVNVWQFMQNMGKLSSCGCLQWSMLIYAKYVDPTQVWIYSVLAGMFHVNLCRGSWGPTGSVLNFEMMKHAFFCLNSLSRNAHLKLFWCQQRVPPRITGFKSRIYATYVKPTQVWIYSV